MMRRPSFRPSLPAPHTPLALVLAALLMSLASALPRAVHADSNCRSTSGEATFYPQGSEPGIALGSAAAECNYLVTAGYAIEGTTVPVGYLAIKSNPNRCLRGRRASREKRLAKGWRAWGTPEDLSISGTPGAHAVLIWHPADESGRVTAEIFYFSQGVYRTDGLQSTGTIDHVTFCQITNLPIVVPKQSIALDAPACCGSPYPKVPGERCTNREILPGWNCRATAPPP